MLEGDHNSTRAFQYFRLRLVSCCCVWSTVVRVMAQGRGSASAAQVAALLVLLCLVSCKVAESATYIVGGRGGWTFNSVGWPNGKRFRAGDVLVFNYSPSAHNVVAVSAAGYRGCTTSRGSTVLKSGRDRVTLRKGPNYFICSFAGHCQAGMKIAVTAA